MPSTVIQWFPGHMAKTRRLIKENLSLVDIVIEILDARIPASSKNPEIISLCAGKPILTVHSKSALSDPEINKQWMAYYKEHGQNALFIDCKTGAGIDKIAPAVKSILSEKIQKYENKGMSGMRLKAMIVGIPNVGKSTLINRLAGSAKAKAEDRPGVTQTKQWVSTSIGIDLLDMPGVLWPKFEDQTVGQNLAATGAIKDDILDLEAIAVTLCGQLYKIAPDELCTRYKLGDPKMYAELEDWELFEKIGRKRGLLVSGGEIDTERTANMILDEFRQAKIGTISLESPNVFQRKDEEHA
ncbi:MAG: ribosome biogenesis GTPase YlqF [Clostridia bacterium]|nr:ribosome biogenesis GTPase YlqF [Clostridia bacterium]